MFHRRASRFAFALAPLLALMACDQAGEIWGKISGSAPTQSGAVTPLADVPLEARALSGAVQPAAAAQALIAPAPTMIAPGEIIVGAKVEQQLAQSAAAMGLAGNLVQSLRSNGEDALNNLPQAVMQQLTAHAEAEAGAAAKNAARIVLQRLGVDNATIQVSAGGVVTVDLTPTGVSPTSLALHGQATAAQAAAAQPQEVAWNPDAGCPRGVSEEQVRADVALATHCAIQRLTASRQFEYVEPNFIGTVDFDRLPWFRAKQTPTPPHATPTAPGAPSADGGLPNDPLLALQWHYKPRGTGAGQSPGGAGFETFWEAHQVGSRAVKVAVVDTGIDRTIPDIASSHNLAPGVDLITSYDRAGDTDGVDADPSDAGDRCGTATENSYHGTHVAGTIGAVSTNDRVGVAGGAWNVTVIPVRVLGKCGGELSDIVGGIRWAAGLSPAVTEDGRQIVNANPADIINLSLSIQAPCPASMQAAIDAAVGRGALVVVAAGNKAANTNNYAPSNCNNVIVVAANDERGNEAFYSNFGPAVDIMAPGGDTSVDSDGDGRPDGVLSTRASTAGCYDPLGNDATQHACYYGFLQGTSMAAPHVAAALALLAAQTGLRGRPLEDALFTRAISPISAAQRDVPCAQYPNAIPIAGQAGVCDRPAGRGMLDLARAAASIAPRAAIAASPRR